MQATWFTGLSLVPTSNSSTVSDFNTGCVEWPKPDFRTNTPPSTEHTTHGNYVKLGDILYFIH